MMEGTADGAPPGPKPADKRSAILRAALAVFAQRGVHAVTVPEIAAEARVATGTIYRHFEGKESLVNELFRQEKTTLIKALYGDLPELPEVPSRSEVRAWFDALWQRMFDHSRREAAVFRFLELQDHRSYLDEASRLLELREVQPIIAFIERFQAAGVYRCDVQPVLILSLVWGAFLALLRGERDGWLVLTRADMEGARNACWDLCTCPTSAERHD